MVQEGNPWASARLTYRAVRPSDAVFIEALGADAWALGNSSWGVMKPMSAQDAQQQAVGLAQMILSVVVCLAPPPSAPTDSAAAASSTAVEPTPIGIIVLKPENVARAHHREASIALDIAGGFRGQGYGSEAIQWLLQWGFQIAGLHRITIESFSYNEGACRLYPRLGFMAEGRKRQSVWFNGEWHDHLIFGMLEDEWRALTGNQKF